MTTVFLDRDGVINHNVAGGYVTCWSDFHFLPGALDALRSLARRGHQVVVISNQSAVSRGLIAGNGLDALHERMCHEIRQAGGRIDAIYCCPHLPEEGCECRKPKPGLILRAAAQLGLDPREAWLIGDHWTDIAAANAAGCRRTILVLSGREPGTGHNQHLPARPLVVARDLSDAVDLITAATHGEREPLLPARSAGEVALIELGQVRGP